MTWNAEDHSGLAWRGSLLFFAAMMIGYSWVVLAASNPPPFVDLPDWVYQGVLFHNVLTGHPFVGYALKHYPVPNSTTTVGLGLLDSLMPWQWAGKVWVVLYLGLASFASWASVCALQLRDWRLTMAMPAILFVNLNFWYGHISFEIGVCLVLLLLAMLVRGRSRGAVAGMLVLVFFTHMEACAAALLLLLLWCAVMRDWRRLAGAVPALALTVWYAIARFASGNADARGVPGADYMYGSKAFLIYKANTFSKSFGFINACARDGSSISEHLLGRIVFVALFAASLAMAAICLVKMARAASEGRPGTPRRVIALFFFALLAISALLPQVWLGVADPGSRLVLLASAAGLLIVDWRGRTGTAIALLSAVFCSVNLYQLARVEQNPQAAGTTGNLPAAMLRYGHVEPATRLEYYKKLQRGELDETIFSTAMFVELPK
jgi:hypothetical protein